MRKSTWFWCGRLTVVLLLALLVAGPAPFAGAPAAYAGQVAAGAPAPVSPPEQAIALADVPGGTATIDCNDPIPGQKAMLIGEDEVALVYHTNNHPALNDVDWDSSGSNLVYKGGSYRSSIAALQSNSWMAIDWGDLNDVQAAGASEFQLSFAQDAAPPGAARATLKPRPQHPLVISDPLSAGVAGTPDGAPAFRMHLPLLFRGQ